MPDAKGGKSKSLVPIADQARKDGFLTRLGTSMAYLIAGITPNTWMSPLQPITPQAPGTKGRLKDYPVGYNLRYTPRGGELTSFEQLRALADNCDLIRTAVETRKNQVGSLQWGIGHKDPSKDVSTDPDVIAIADLFRKPDGFWPWQTWISMIVEEVCVSDALAIVPRYTLGGEIAGFELLDGATIKILTDVDGRTPIAPSPAYEQVLKGNPTSLYTTDEMIYRPRNPRVHKFYGFSNVEQVLMTVNIALRREYSQLQWFTEGNIPDAYGAVPLDWMPEQIEEFQKYWDTEIEGKQEYRRKIRFGPGGMKLERMREAPLKDDFDEWLARIVCFCFSLPPTPFIRQLNRSTAQESSETSESEGLAPLTIWIKQLIDELIATYIGRSDLEFRWIEKSSVDPKQQADVLSKYQEHGVFSINEIRQKLGENPIEDPMANSYIIISGGTAIPLDALGDMTQFGANGQSFTPANAKLKPNTDSKTATGPVASNKDAKNATTATNQSDNAVGPTKYDSGHLHKLVGDTKLTPGMSKIKDSAGIAMDEIRDSAIKAVDSLSKAADDDASEKDDTAREAAIFGAILAAIDYAGWNLIREDLIAAIAQAAHEAAMQSLDNDSFDLDAATKWAESRAAELLGDDGANGFLADATQTMLQRALEAGGTTDADGMKAVIGSAYGLSLGRAEVIGRTEILNAIGQGSFLGAQAAGYAAKRWLKSELEGVCPVCEVNAAQGWIPIGQEFLSGDDAPLAHVNCRCDIAFRNVLP